MSFDLATEPWIPVRLLDGTVMQTSLRELYSSAPTMRELAVDFALEYVATLRLLATILQSAMGERASRVTKARWLQEPRRCAEEVDAYLDRWATRLDLFDPHRPFMQRVVGEEVSVLPVSALRADWASGNNATLFDHHVDARSRGIHPGEATRALLATLLFQPGGGVSQPFNRTDSPGTKSLHAVVVGSMLWETLVLNVPPMEVDDQSRPIWEREPSADHVPDKEGTPDDGWLDRATWRSRAIQLIPDPDGIVRWCRMHQHLKLVDAPPFDRYAPIHRVEGEEDAPMRASPSRALWRDADALLRGLSAEEGVVYEATRIAEDLGTPAPSARIVGQVVRQAKVADVVDARLPLSASLLADDERIAVVAALVATADTGVRAYRVAVKAYADALGVSSGWSLTNQGEAELWARLGTFFRLVLADVAAAAQAPLLSDPLVVDWRARVAQAVRRAYDELGEQGALSPPRLRALAIGQASLRRALSKLTPKEAVA